MVASYAVITRQYLGARDIAAAHGCGAVITTVEEGVGARTLSCQKDRVPSSGRPY